MRGWHILRSQRLLILTALLLIAFIAATPAQAAEGRGGNQVVIGRDEVIGDDLYVAGNTVTIDGTVKGDLVAVAGQITINGTVAGDVLAVLCALDCLSDALRCHRQLMAHLGA